MNFLWREKGGQNGFMRKRSDLPVSTLYICTDERNGENWAGRAYCRLFPSAIKFRDKNSRSFISSPVTILLFHTTLFL